MLNRNELKEIIKNNPGTYIGLRGTEQPLEIGEILETSYRWDYEQDISSYDTDEPEELGGVCAIQLDNWDIYDEQFNNTDEDLEELINEIEEKIEIAKELYHYYYNYIVTSKIRNPLDYEENDENEIILANAEVMMEIK